VLATPEIQCMKSPESQTGTHFCIIILASEDFIPLKKSVDEIRSKSAYIFNYFIFKMSKKSKGGFNFDAQLLSYQAVQHYVSLGRSTIEKLVKENKFPKPRKFEGTNKWLFLKVEIDLWIQGGAI